MWLKIVLFDVCCMVKIALLQHCFRVCIPADPTAMQVHTNHCWHFETAAHTARVIQLHCLDLRSTFDHTL